MGFFLIFKHTHHLTIQVFKEIYEQILSYLFYIKCQPLSSSLLYIFNEIKSGFETCSTSSHFIISPLTHIIKRLLHRCLINTVVCGIFLHYQRVRFNIKQTKNLLYCMSDKLNLQLDTFW